MVNASTKAAANKASDVETTGENAAVSTGTNPADTPADKPKRTRSAPKTLDERIAEMRAKYEASESKRKARVLKEIGEVEDRIGKEQTKLIELTKERNDLRASIGLSPEDIDAPEQGPDADEILADPVAAGDTTAQQVARS